MAQTSVSVGALMLASCGILSAGSFTQIVSFGDSLSDNGNALIVYQNPAMYGPYPAGAPVPTPPNYTLGRFTDGPDTTPASKAPGLVWVEDLASKLGLPDPKPSLAGGTNYAIGSAQTGTANPQDMGNQVALYLFQNGGAASATSLYTFWGGGNDLLAGESPTTAANNISSDIAALAAAGGKDFLWLNLPPTPTLPGALQFDAAMAADLIALETMFPNDMFASVNVAGFYESGAGGLDPNCIGDQSANPDLCLTWDGLHPTNIAHQDIANLADAALTGVPEPSLAWITGMSLAGLAGLRLRKGVR